MKKRELIALLLAITGIVWYFVENFYFGWHFKATSVAEEICDSLVWMVWVIAFFIRPTRIEKHHTEINTKNVEIIKSEVTIT